MRVLTDFARHHWRQLLPIIAMPLLTILLCIAGWSLLTADRASAQSEPGEPEPTSTRAPAFFLVDPGMATTAAIDDNEIGVNARLTIGRLSDMPAGSNPQAFCPTTKSIEATADEDLFYCYRLENTGSQTLTRHTLVDSRFGVIFDDETQIVTPGYTIGYYEIGKAEVSSTDYMTWTAFTTSNEPLTDFSRATAIVPELQLTVTAGVDPAICAPPGRLMMENMGDAVFCLQVYNPNDFALDEHQAYDGAGNPVSLPEALHLPPGESTYVTFTAPVTQPTFSEFTWTAKSATQSTPVTATDGVEVRIPHITTALLFAYAEGSDCVSSTLTATVGTDIIYCYVVINDGSVPLENHLVTDSVFGEVERLNNSLNPGQSIGLGITRTLTGTTTSIATWRAEGPGSVAVEASVAGTVVIAEPARLDVRVYLDNGTHQYTSAYGLPDRAIDITDPAGRISRERSDEYGIASFLNLIPGVYRVEVTDTATTTGTRLLVGSVMTASISEGATVVLEFPFTGTLPMRYVNLPLIKR